MPAGDRIVIARIGAPRGVAGDVRVTVFADDPQALAAYGPLSTSDGRQLTVRSVRPAGGGGGAIVAFDGVADRDAAAQLTGVELFADRAAFPPTDDDEFYRADLIGLAAFDPEGAAVGTVVAVHNHGAGDIVEIAPPGPGAGDTMLLPFTRETFPEIDIGNGRVVVVRPGEIEVRPPDADSSPAKPPPTNLKEKP